MALGGVLFLGLKVALLGLRDLSFGLALVLANLLELLLALIPGR
jgi:hypothetical protein